MTGGEPVASLSFAIGAGIAAFFSPCAYALLPGYVGYYVAATGEETAPLSGAMARGLAATVGAAVVLAGLAGVAIVAGTLVERVLPLVEYGVGVALIALGAWILLSGPGAVHVLLPERRASVVGFGVFGAMYALAATACVLPVFLAIALRTATMPPVDAAVVLGGYAGGFGAMMLSVTVATAVGHGLGGERLTEYTSVLVRAAGALIVLAGLGQLWVAAA